MVETGWLMLRSLLFKDEPLPEEIPMVEHTTDHPIDHQALLLRSNKIVAD